MLWLVIEENQYTIQMMKEYYQSSDIELYCIPEYRIETALKNHKFDIVLVSFNFLRHVSMISYFKDYHLPVIVYDGNDEDEKMKELQYMHVDHIFYGQINYHQILMMAHQLIKEYTPKEDEYIYFKDLKLNLTKVVLHVGDQRVDIDEREAMILELLMRHPYQAYPKDKIKELLFKDQAIMDTARIEQVITNLVNKLNKVNPEERYISNVWQTGYKMAID